jgi:PKD repeat protein
LHSLSKPFNLTLLATLLSVAFSAPAFAQAQTSAARGKAVAAKPAFPAMRTNDLSNGESAVAKLGGNLPAVAAHYGKTPAEFAKQLRADRSAWLDKSGRVFFVEKALTTSGSNLAPSGAIYPAAQTFLLHSRPGSKRKIYLDFNGHTATGTEWNSSYGLGSIVSPAFDLDNIPGTFSTLELNTVQNIWRRVAEDYAPFDVDVTTEEPPVDQMVRLPWPYTDDAFGIRAVITKDFTTSTLKGSCACGGFAYLGVFDDTTESRKPAYIFYDKLGSAEKSIAEAVSHEVGHTLGLSHDGTSTEAYYGGLGYGPTGWAPIMGVGYSRELVQFSKGEYGLANNMEDDFQVMQNNGLQFAADDFGNFTTNAATLTGTLVNGISTYDARGLIETPSDVDFFKFNTSAGTVTIDATPFELSPNLDVQLEVRNASGVLVASANPSEALNASLSFVAPAAGSYYLSVQGVGRGIPALYTYSDYGSLGRYAFRVTAPLAATPPVCSIRATVRTFPDSQRVSFSGGGSSDSLGPIQSYQWDFGDDTYATGVSSVHMYYEGTYVATLTVTNSAGMSSSCSYTTTVTSSGMIP